MMEHMLTEKRPRRLPYASLAEVRRAILRRHLIHFIHHGCEVIAEPHLLGRGSRTGAYYLKGLNAADGQWEYYRFCEIRGFEELKESFAPRRDVWEGERKIVALDTQARW
jgi:hypothetical protein